jgi:hypothetical protein
MLQIFDAMSRDRNVTTQVKEGDGDVTSDDTPPPIKGDIKSRPLGMGDGMSQEQISSGQKVGWTWRVGLNATRSNCGWTFRQRTYPRAHSGCVEIPN